MINIGPFEFNIERAVLQTLIFKERCVWQFKIFGVQKEIHGSAVPWRPYIYSEDILHLSDQPLGIWQDALQDISWKNCYDDKLEKCHANISIMGHDDIKNGAITFGKPTGRSFDFNLKGICEFNFEIEEYGDTDFDECPLEVKTEMIYLGVKVVGYSYEEALSLVQKYINKDSFEEETEDEDQSFRFLPVVK